MSQSLTELEGEEAWLIWLNTPIDRGIAPKDIILKHEAVIAKKAFIAGYLAGRSDAQTEA